MDFYHPDTLTDSCRPKPVLDDADSEPGLGMNLQNILSSQEEHDFLTHSLLPSFLQALYLKGLLVNKGLRPALRALELAEQEEMLKEKDMAKALLSATDDGEGVPV